MNKDLIKQRFEKRLQTYDDNAKIQKIMAEKLSQKIYPSDVNKILELGCGTGLLTKLINKKLRFNQYTAIDIVSQCNHFIKTINPDIEFVNLDIENYVSTCGNYDLIISNASLQWIENLPELINNLMQKLNSGGKLIFSVFGKENYKEIKYTIGKSLNYYSAKELSSLLQQYNPTIEEELYTQEFLTPKDVLKHIRNTGVNAISAETWTKKDLKNFENRYNLYCNNSPVLTYNPIYVEIKKA